MIELTHTTIKNQLIPLENIDYIGELETGNVCDDNYKVYLKSSNVVNVSSGRNYDGLKRDRMELVNKFNIFLNQSKPPLT